MLISTTEAPTPPWTERACAWAARSLAIAALLSWPMVSVCLGQERAGDSQSGAGKTPQKAGSQAVQYVGPDTYILLDAQGRPQVMPGMTYDDFMAAWKKLQHAEDRETKPRYTIESLAFEGKANGDRAELKCRARIRILADEAVEVPLGLVGSILARQPQWETAAREEGSPTRANDAASGRGAPPDEFVDFDPTRGGLVAHLRRQAGDVRNLTLDLLTPLTRDGAETTLALNCPRALTSTLSIDVAGPVSDAAVSSGAILSREPAPDRATRLTVSGLAGQFRLSWNTSKVATAEASTVLSANGALQVAIDGRSVRTEARLTVRSYGGSFDRFRVRLPDGATLVERRAKSGEKEPAYRITLEDSTSGGGVTQPAAAPVVLIQLPAKQQGPIVVELTTEQPLELSNTDVPVKLGGFEVLGAVRQFGDITLRVAENWQARWDAGQYVRQVDASELDPTLQQAGLTGAFQYDRQPWSLDARVAPREIRVQVTPEYVLDCLPDEVRLKVHLTYQVLGGRAYALRVDLRGWEQTTDPLESGGLVDRDRVRVSDAGILELPISQPSLRGAEIGFTLRRSFRRDPGRFELPLPIPLAESVATGDLVVRVTPDVELMPDATRSKGLSATPIVSDTPADDDNDFHFRCFQADAVFAAERLTRPRDVTVEATNQVQLGGEHADIRQRIDYDVRFQPIMELQLDVPHELLSGDQTIEAILLSGAADDAADDGQNRAGQPLRLVAPEPDGDPTHDSLRRARVVLPRPRLGRFTVELRYGVPRPPSVAREAGWSLPLVLPVDGRLTECRAIVDSPPNLAVALEANLESIAWTESQSNAPTSQAREGKTFTSPRAESSLPLVVRTVDANLPSATVVERVWLQTWLTASARQDRAAFRFRTAGRLVAVELPPETSADEVEVLLDGRPADVLSRQTGRISVQFDQARSAQTGDEVSPRSHTLELRYRRASADRIVTRRRFTPPQIVGTKALADVYWHLVLPADRHVIQSPPQLAAASQWQWLGTFWGRRPTRTQADLEAWVGASVQQPPTAAQNEYLYCGLSPMSTIEIVTAPRWLVVLASSGAVLALVLAWIYVPAVRRRWVVVGLAVGLACLAVAYPTPAMLIGQASMLGVVLSLLAMLISRLAARPTQWYLPPASTGSTRRRLTPRESAVVATFAPPTASTAPTATFPLSESKT